MTGRVIFKLYSDLILELIENKSDRKYWPSKFNWMRFHLMVGAGKVSTLLID
jgi:hypothetical protein